MTTPAGTCPRDGKPLALACQLCPISSTYWRLRMSRLELPAPDVDVHCRVIGRAEKLEGGDQ